MSFATIARYAGIAALGLLTWTFIPKCDTTKPVNHLEGVVKSSTVAKFPPTMTINPNTRHVMVLEGCDGNKYTLDLGWQYDNNAAKMAGMASPNDYAKIEVEEASGPERTALDILVVSSAGKSACPKPDAGISYDAGVSADATVSLDSGTATTSPAYDAGVSADATVSADALPLDVPALDARVQYDSQVSQDSGVAHPDASAPKPDATPAGDAALRIIPDVSGKITYADGKPASSGRLSDPNLEQLRTGNL